MKLQEESSNEIQIMTFLKNERLSDSVTKNETEISGIVSTDNLYISPEVMTSPPISSMIESSPSVVKRTLEEGHSEEETHSTSDQSTVINHNFINQDSAAVQPQVVDQIQD